jgi:hypothetical protein
MAFQTTTLARRGILTRVYSSCVCQAGILYFAGDSIQAQERLTNLPLTITEGTVLHGLENCPNFGDFVIDMFTEKKSSPGTEGQDVKVKIGLVVADHRYYLMFPFSFIR